MYNHEPEFLFPPHIIPQLGNLRGDLWTEIVNRVANKNTELDRMAFVLLMVRLNGCASCRADSYKAMRGCTKCSSQTLSRFPGSDVDLESLFTRAREDIESFIDKNSFVMLSNE